MFPEKKNSDFLMIENKPWTMVAYFCLSCASYFSIKYVDMKDKYVDRKDNYVDMQENYNHIRIMKYLRKI